MLASPCFQLTRLKQCETRDFIRSRLGSWWKAPSFKLTTGSSPWGQVVPLIFPSLNEEAKRQIYSVSQSIYYPTPNRIIFHPVEVHFRPLIWSRMPKTRNIFLVRKCPSLKSARVHARANLVSCGDSFTASGPLVRPLGKRCARDASCRTFTAVFFTESWTASVTTSTKTFLERCLCGARRRRRDVGAHQLRSWPSR